MESAAKSNLKRVSLELGGKSPIVVFPDVDRKKRKIHLKPKKIKKTVFLLNF